MDPYYLITQRAFGLLANRRARLLAACCNFALMLALLTAATHVAGPFDSSWSAAAVLQPRKGLQIELAPALQSADSAKGKQSDQTPPPLASDPVYTVALQYFNGVDLQGKDGALQKLSFDLVYLLAEFEHYRAQRSRVPFQSSLPLLHLIADSPDPLVVIDAVAVDSGPQLLATLQGMGLRNGSAFGVVVSGQLPIPKLEEMAALEPLRFAEAALAATNAGLATSQGDLAMRSAAARSNFGVTGNGIKIGVLSDSFDCLGGAAADVASGDLPNGIIVLAEPAGCAIGKDEGRAMMQLMTDIAPDAQLAFHTAFEGRANFANGIVALAETTGAQIMVDDVLYYNEPMFQDGIVAQAVDQVAATGVSYFSSAGNTGRQAYQSSFTPSLNLPMISSGLLHDFDPGPGVDPLQAVTIPVGATAVFSLQWDQPYASATGGAGAANDLDLVLVGPSLSPLAVSINNNIGRNPVEVLQYTNPGPGTTFMLAVAHLRGPVPQLFKYVYFGPGVTVDEYTTHSSTLYGHASAVGATAIGAAFYAQTPAFGRVPPRLEPFSAGGPVSILFDGTDQPVIDIRRKPELVAPDGTNNTFFGKDIADPGDGSERDTWPNFFGTSAAAPHAAAVAALLLEAKPTLSPTDLYALIIETALPMGESSFDENAGYGLIQADQALAQLFRHDITSRLTGTPMRVLPGQPITYTLSLLNTGPNLAPTLQLTATLPELQEMMVDSVSVGAAPPLTALTTTPVYSWRSERLQSGAGYIVTIKGKVNPTLSADTSLVVSANATSAADTVTDNNKSQSTITAVVPQVQFGSYTLAVDGSQLVTLTLDFVNPYADVTVQYSSVYDSAVTGSERGQLSGTARIVRGQTTTTIRLPAPDQLDERISLILRTPSGARLGKESALIFTNPYPSLDADGDGIPNVEEDLDGDGNLTNDDTDGDGTPNYLDVDDDGDGVPTKDEDPNNDGAPQNDDTDGDGMADYLDADSPVDQVLPTTQYLPLIIR